jgi:hypothetical protein
MRGIQVLQGKFRVSTVDVVVNARDCMVLEIDCHSKYPGWAVNGANENEVPFVMIFHDERSLKLDDTTDLITQVTLPRRTAGWQVIAEGARYTVRIAAWRVRDRKQAWISPPENEDNQDDQQV